VYETCVELPFRYALLVVIFLFLALYFAVPALLTRMGVWGVAFASIPRVFAPLLSGVALLGGLAGILRRVDWRSLLSRQSGLTSIRAESWQDFEPLIAEAYRRRGYRVKMRGGPGADGGVDLELEGQDGRIVVQCKQRTRGTIGVEVVRALFGVMIHETADRAILVTSASFTDAARAFAANKPIELIDGKALARLIREAHVAAETPPCPKCGKPMVWRTARKGGHAGESFWGCSTYPACKGLRLAA